MNEAGGHRWQELSGKGKKAKIHTSTVTVSVILDGDAKRQRVSRHDDDFAVSFYSGTGKGGQHRNKHQNCVRMTHLPTGLKQTANGRERQANLDAARAALEAQLDAMESDGAHGAANALRKDQIGSGQRGDKRRTYRFQDDRVADHDNGRSMRCRAFMKGNIEELWS